jgi:hypothetical protein
VPKFTLAVDSSQISTFLECPQKWVNFYVKRLEPLNFQPDESLNMGSYGHKLLEIYYRAKARGVGLNDSFKLMDAYNPDKDNCECGCGKDFHQEIPELGITECVRCRKCTNFRPKPLELPTKVRDKVRKRMILYCNEYQRDDVQPTSEQHVEVGFSEPIYEDSDNLFVLEGRIDLIGKLQGLDCFVDHKIQGKMYWLYMRSVQIKNYMLITKVPMAVINYIRLGDKVEKGSTFARDIITLNKIEVDVWHKRLVAIFFRMKKTVQTFQSSRDGIDRDWNACSGGKLTYDKSKPAYCWYGPLCEEVDPVVALRKEQQLFKIKENPWRPW